VSASRGRRRLIAAWAVLLALLGAIALIEYADRAPGTEAVEDRAGMLLPVSADQLVAVELSRAGRLHRFQRDEKGAWFYHGTHGAQEPAHEHALDPERARFIAHTLAGFGRARIERRFPADRTERYGLATPQAVIVVYAGREPGPLTQFAVGDVAPDTVSRYVEVVGGAGVVTIPNYQIDNLRALIAAVAANVSGAPRGARPRP